MSGAKRALVLCAALAVPSAVWPQKLDWRLVPGAFSGGVELGLERNQQSTQTATSSSGSTTQRLRETVRLSNTGFYVLDPRLITGSLGVQIGLAQTHANGSVASGTDKDRTTGYDLNLTALKNKPYLGNFFANRSHSTNNQAFGGTTDGTRESHGIRLELHEDSILKDKGFPWFKAELTAQQDHSTNTTTFFDRVTRQDERNKQVTFFAQKGFLTADLDARYFLLNDTQTASMNHSVDFGEGLNHTLNSTFSTTQRDGAVPSKSIDWGESLSLVHSRTLASNYTYSFTRYQDTERESHEHKARAELTHELYTNLTSNASAEGDQLVLPDGKVTSTNINLGQIYRHSLPRAGALILNWSAGYGQTNNNLASGLVHVTAERHQALAPFGGGNGFFLTKVNAVASSVTVFNVTTGVAVPATEFDVVTIGNRVRIEPLYRLPSAPRNPIEPDDMLDVGYDYQLDPHLRYETRSMGFGGAVNYGWINGSYQHQQSNNNLLEGQGLLVHSLRSDSVSVTLNQRLADLPTSLTLSRLQQTDTPLNGDPALLNTVRTDSVLYRIDGMMIREVQTNASASYTRSNKLQDLDQIFEATSEFEVNGFWHEFSGQARATLNNYQSNRLAFRRRLLISTLNWQVDYRMSVIGSVNFSDVSYTSSNLHDSLRSARATARWTTEDGWRNDVFTEIRLHDDGRAGTETVLQLGGRTSWSIGKLSLNGGASYDRFVRGASKSSGLRFDVSALRSF